MYDFEKYEKLIKSRLSEYRYTHSMNVAKRAKELAKIYSLDEDKSYLAGILHDITKETDYAEQEKYMDNLGIIPTELEKSNKLVYHQISGACYVKSVLGIDDEEILSAIRYHTTGHAEMTDFEMVIYLADLTSVERSYPDVESVRELADNSLTDAMLCATRFTITDLANKNKLIHPDTLYCYNWVLQKTINGQAD
ncbi:bis(5'-nucleosyl)-tetraphosphatase (symmetrical) YqeK [uncultured Eubacterium sp.]|uniref:bis(5'-nucleosyl)-tetraphosphatase (symmetrical) YqeK n=1 Tax=uncultured Eubacterium sp. TaxID=165185 RepID=UPI002585CF3D|nr:bis(5'-nucleosyl)-tetraphosphatase (symmetrical) YqeK [uncultured Eubacterium sp.]